MTIPFQCTECGKAYKLADTMAGKRGKCTECGTIMVIPAAGNLPAGGPKSARRTAGAAPPVKTRPRRPEPEDEDDEADAPSGRNPLVLAGVGLALVLLLGGGSWAAYKFIFNGDSQPLASQAQLAQDDRGKLLPGSTGPVVAPTNPAPPPSTGAKPPDITPTPTPTPTVPTAIAADWSSGLQFLPDPCQLLVSIRVNQVATSAALKQLEAMLPFVTEGKKEFKDKAGMDVADIEYVLVGASAKDATYAMVVWSRMPVTPKQLMDSAKDQTFTEEKVGRFTLYKAAPEDSSSFCPVAEQVTVVGPSEMLKKILERDRKAELSPGLLATMGALNTRSSIFVAGDLAAVLEGETALPVQMALQAPEFAPAKEPLKNVSSLALEIQVDADFSLVVTALCKGEAAAATVQQTVQQFQQVVQQNQSLPAFLQKLAKDFLVSTTGARVKGLVKVNTDTVVELLKVMMVKPPPPPGQ
jgi:hypothetical protein